MATREITLIVSMDQEPTVEEVKAMGRDAARGLLDHSGIRAPYGSRNIAESVRVGNLLWQSSRYTGPAESRDWAVTSAEIQEWDDREAEYDEEDEDW